MILCWLLVLILISLVWVLILIRLVMEIKVYLSLSAYQNRKTCFCKRIDVVSGMQVDFGLLLRVMRVMYGENCIVEFLIVN